MSIFRNVVFVAALAGLVSGVVLTALADLRHRSADPPSRGLRKGRWPASMTMLPFRACRHGSRGARARNMKRKPGRLPTALSASPSMCSPDLVTGIGFALILVAVSEFAGGIGSWRHGLFWGLAGFAVFTLAPGLGLPPELPAMPAADLTARQVWWWGTVLATAAGLAMIAFRRSPVFALLGVALIVAPHVVGAPQPAELRDADPGRPAPPVRGGGDDDQSGVLGRSRRSDRLFPVAVHRHVGRYALELCLRRQA